MEKEARIRFIEPYLRPGKGSEERKNQHGSGRAEGFVELSELRPRVPGSDGIPESAAETSFGLALLTRGMSLRGRGRRGLAGPENPF